MAMPPPPPPSVYIHRSITNMKNSYQERGRTGLAEEILSLERGITDFQRRSRLLYNQNYPRLAYSLLLQIPPTILDSILSNRLMQDIHNGSIKPDRWCNIDFGCSSKAGIDPGIYVNFITQNTGKGMSIPQYERFYDRMVAVIEGSMITDPNTGNSIDPRDAVNQYFMHYTNNRRQLTEVEEIIDSCELHIDDFKKHQQALIDDAKRVGSNEIRSIVEVGWAIDVNHRVVKEHHKLRGSANFFKLAFLVLGALYRNTTTQFKMKSFCIFRVMQATHAEIGESVGTHLFGAYFSCGGFNFTQASMSVDTANRTIETNWKLVCGKNADLLSFIQIQLSRDKNHWEMKVDESERQLHVVEAVNELKGLGDDIEDLRIELVEENRKAESEIKGADAANARLTNVFENDEKTSDFHLTKLRNLARGLGVYSKTLPDTQPPSSSPGYGGGA